MDTMIDTVFSAQASQSRKSATPPEKSQAWRKCGMKRCFGTFERRRITQEWVGIIATHGEDALEQNATLGQVQSPTPI